MDELLICCHSSRQANTYFEVQSLNWFERFYQDMHLLPDIYCKGVSFGATKPERYQILYCLLSIKFFNLQSELKQSEYILLIW